MTGGSQLRILQRRPANRLSGRILHPYLKSGQLLTELLSLLQGLILRQHQAVIIQQRVRSACASLISEQIEIRTERRTVSGLPKAELSVRRRTQPDAADTCGQKNQEGTGQSGHPTVFRSGWFGAGCFLFQTKQCDSGVTITAARMRPVRYAVSDRFRFQAE